MKPKEVSWSYLVLIKANFIPLVNVTKMGSDMTKSDAAYEKESMLNAKKMGMYLIF